MCIVCVWKEVFPNGLRSSWIGAIAKQIIDDITDKARKNMPDILSLETH